MQFLEKEKYRTEIDGLRAVAILPVLLFHLAFLKNGYLGVDVFFVISGYLITGIIAEEILQYNFSLINFYKRRIRRILPLITTVTTVSLAIGTFTLLPYNLEKLSRSVIATNFFGNNILQVIVSRRYWDVMNEFEPLLHTWSLGVEEQFYLLYPFIFLLFKKKYFKFLLPLLIVLSLLSIAIHFFPFSYEAKFYLLPFRFFELAVGGIVALLLKNRLIHSKLAFLPIVLLLAILFTNFIQANRLFLTCIVVALTGIILALSNKNNPNSNAFLGNKAVVYIGKISFSLYLWHQVVIAFYRSTIAQELSYISSVFITLIVFALSTITYNFIEQPFRNTKRISFKATALFVAILLLLSTGVSYVVYTQKGIVKNYPELDYFQHANAQNLHSTFVDRVYELDKNFEINNKIKVLVVGNSFARDWANVLLEWDSLHNLEISYLYAKKNYAKTHNKIKSRGAQADLIFFSEANFKSVQNLKLSIGKVWCVGTKNFGVNNGIIYNYRGNNYCMQRVSIQKNIVEKNKRLKQQWGNAYIDLMAPLIDVNNTIPAFTKQCKFISHDSRHLTPAGASFFATIFNEQINAIVHKTE